MPGLERRFIPITNEALRTSFPDLAKKREAIRHFHREKVSGYSYLSTIEPSEIDDLVFNAQNKKLKQLGRDIRVRRAEKEMRQEDLAQISDVDRAIISNLENGKNRPTAPNLLRIARGLGLDEPQMVQVFSEANYVLPQIKPQVE